jgi:hypothetical protein
LVACAAQSCYLNLSILAEVAWILQAKHLATTSPRSCYHFKFQKKSYSKRYNHISCQETVINNIRSVRGESSVDATQYITRWHSSALLTQWWVFLRNAPRAVKATSGKRCSENWLVTIGGSPEKMRPRSIGAGLLAQGTLTLLRASAQRTAPTSPWSYR